MLRVFRLGCIVTIRGGRGVVVAKLDNGKFSDPVPLKMGGVAVGADIGLQMTDVIIALKHPGDLHAFTSTTGSIGLNGSFCIGPFGYEGEGAVVDGDTATMSIGHSKGLYGGLSLEFTGITINMPAMREAYGNDATAASIFNGTCVAHGQRKAGSGVQRLRQTIAKLAGSSRSARASSTCTPTRGQRSQRVSLTHPNCKGPLDDSQSIQESCDEDIDRAPLEHQFVPLHDEDE